MVIKLFDREVSEDEGRVEAFQQVEGRVENFRSCWAKTVLIEECFQILC